MPKYLSKLMVVTLRQKAMTHWIVAAIFVVWAISVCRTVAADDQFDRIIYGSDRFNNMREITYWGIARLDVYDYEYGTGDAAMLKLTVKRGYSEEPSPTLKNHFLQEFKRLFGALPFHDLNEGRAERFTKFDRENRPLGKDTYEGFRAAEEARRKALYPGRAGAVDCTINVKRRNFPILYEARCGLSGDDDFFQSRYDEAKDLGFSTPEHIEKELMRVVTMLLEKKKGEFDKVRKYSKSADK